MSSDEKKHEKQRPRRVRSQIHIARTTSQKGRTAPEMHDEAMLPQNSHPDRALRRYTPRTMRGLWCRFANFQTGGLPVATDSTGVQRNNPSTSSVSKA